MANSKRFVVKNGLETQNIQFVEQDGTETIILTVLDDGSLSFSGSSGQLFSIVDSLTGSIFSVNDISGIPSIEVFDDGKVILAESTGNVGIGILTPTEKLTVSGNVSATRLISTQATGTSPLAVASTTVVTNLNADTVDGLHSTSLVQTTGDQSIAGTKTFSGDKIVLGNSSGDEGGEILFAKPQTNSTIAGTGVTIDMYQNRLRFFEQGGDARGFYLDITSGGNSAATNLASGGGTVTSVSAGTQISGMAMTITNGTTTPSIATSISDAANFRAAIGAGTGNGTVTSVTGTSPVASSGGTTPAISLASGYGDTQNPYASKTQKTFLAAPNAADGVPSFRTIAASDIPTLNQNTTGTSAGVVATVTGTNSTELVRGNMADNDQARILVGGTATNAGFLEIATADDGTEPIHVRQYTGTFTTLTRTATLLDGSGNTSFPGTVTGTRLISNIATGTAPLSVTSTTVVTNLNADTVDGLDSSSLVQTTGDQSIAGTKTFTGNVNISGALDLTNAGVISALDLSNNVIVGVGNITINDPGPNEGIDWAGGNLWKIWESPNDLTTNGAGNLQIVQNTTRRATFNTSGQLEIPVSTGTAPFAITSTTAVTNLNADTVDGFHAAGLSKRVNLAGQVQTTDYRKSVIALCELTNSNPSANSYSMGMITFHRTNGLTAPALMQIAMEKRFNVVGANYTSFVQSGDSFGDNIQYIKFQYNGIWYGGIEFFFSDATLSEVTFHGESNFAIFGLDYFNTQTSTVINSEINSSITVTDMVAENDLFINNNKVWNAQNDGSGSGLDADLLDGLNSEYFLNTSVTGQTKTGLLTLGSNGTDYTGNSGANHNLFLNGSTYSSIGFHDSANTIGHIRFSAVSGFEIGRADGTYGPHNTIMYGNVGIGTATPAVQLDVVGGNVRIQSGSTLEYGNASTRIVGNSGTGGFFRFDTENTERMRIIGNGNVGIGTTTPSEKLHVVGKALLNNGGNLYIDSTSSDSIFATDGARGIIFNSNSTNRLYVNPSGLVGINEASPSTQLQVKSGANNRVALYVNTTNAFPTHTAPIQEWATAGVVRSFIDAGGELGITGLYNPTSSSNSYIQTLSTGTVIRRNIADTNPTLIVNQIHASSTGDILKVQAAGTDRLTVKRDGKVGIGTTTPGESLSVEGDAYVKDRLRVGLISSGNDSIYLENSINSVDGAGGLYHNSGDQTIAAFRQSPNEYLYAGGSLKFVESTDTFEVNGNLTVNGNIINTGSTVTVNTSNLTVTDKNIELGFITPKTGLVATLATGTANITLTGGATTEGMIPGQALTKTAGTGVFGASARIATITGLTTLTATINHATAGSITFTASGATDFTADGGGITLKGDNDHRLEWNKNLLGNGAWTFSSDKLYLLSETLEGDKLVIEDTDLEEGALVKISSVSTLPNDVGGALLRLNYQATTSATDAYIYGIDSVIQPASGVGSTSYAYAGKFSSSGAIANYGVDAQAQALNSGNSAYALTANAIGVSGATVVAISASVSGASTSKYTFRGIGGTLYNEGSVGIGTDTPLNKLDIRITGADSNDGIMVSRADATTTTNEILGGIGFDSTDGNVPSSVLEASAYIAAFAAEDHSTGDKGGYLTFGTAPIDQDDDTVSSERMRIEAGGNVGIGVTTTNAQLDVKDTFHITNSGNTQHGIMIENRTTYFNSTGKVGIWSSAGITGGDFSGQGSHLIIEGRKNTDRHIYIKVGDTTTATHIFKADASVGINTTAPTAKLDVNGDLKHTGLTMTTGTNVDQTKETTFTSALTTAWTDVTGVSGTYLATGSYIVQIISNGEYYTGEMSWFSGTTTSTTADEIVLHRAGPAASAGRIFARVVRTSSAPSTLKLQVSGSTTISSHTMTFKFRRTI